MVQTQYAASQKNHGYGERERVNVGLNAIYKRLYEYEGPFFWRF